MQIKILPRQNGGTEFLAQPQRLHLGAQNAAGVDRLEFLLPECWSGCSAALYLRRSDGTLLAPIPLDEHNSITVDRRLTGCTGGQWMLSAVRESGYTAHTRPGSYDVYATLPTDGGSEELSPSLYEQFVARVLESASTAASAAQKASADAAQTAADAKNVQSAVQKILSDRTDAADCAARSEAAAARAEKAVAESGAVVSVNGKGGAVRLDAADVHAVPRPALPVSGELLRVLSVDPDDGTLITDTTPPPDLSPYLRKDTVPDAQTAGGVRADPQYGITVRADGTMTLVPASAEKLDLMTDIYAPITPAQLPYGVKKALTSSAALWSTTDQSSAQKVLGVPDNYYTKEQADARFGSAYALPAATADTLGGVKVGAELDIAADGTLSAQSLKEELTETIAASVAVKSESRQVWEGYQEFAKNWKSVTIDGIPENVDLLSVKVEFGTYSYYNTFSISKGNSVRVEMVTTSGGTSMDADVSFRSGAFTLSRSYSSSLTLTVWLTGYHYPTLAELLADTQTAQEDTDALLVDQEYRLTLLELGITE